MADLASTARAPAKHSFGQLARRSMNERSRPDSTNPPQADVHASRSVEQIEGIALAAHEAFEERAGIMEFDGGMTREDAELASQRLRPLPPRG